MNNFENMLQEQDVRYCVVLSTDGRSWREFGDRTALPYKGLADSYFPGPQIAGELNSDLEESILPQIVSQGDLTCFLMKPKPDLIVGAFVIDQGDIHTLVARSKTLDALVSKALGRQERE